MNDSYRPPPLSETVYLFTRAGLGSGPDELQSILVVKLLSLITEAGELPAKMLFYTDGVKLACSGSAVLSLLKKLEASGVELILCKTCLDYYSLTGQVEAGIVGSMADIIDSLHKAGKVISL